MLIFFFRVRGFQTIKYTKKLEKSCNKILDFNSFTDQTLPHFVSFAIAVLP